MNPTKPAASIGRTAGRAFIIILLAVTAFQRNETWTTKLSLWTDVVKKTPMKSRVHNSLGNCYWLLGKHFKAIEEYKRALVLDRNNVEAYFNLGSNLDIVGIYNQAIYYYDFFCKAAPPAFPEATKTACERADALSRELGVVRR